MKKTIIVLASLILAASTYAQSTAGTVVFANSTATAITNTVTGTRISGASAFTIGLYVGAANETSNQLVLVGTSLNSSLSAGTFSGGNPFTINTNLVASAITGNSVAFQIRAWSTAGGASYEAAYAAAQNNTAILVGTSTLVSSSLALGGGTTPAAALFGSGAGLVGSFTVSPAPEPTTILLGCLGGAALLVARRRK
jgi:hypothetical protein